MLLEVHWLLLITTVAIMSRPVAGVYNSSIIVTLPGSPKGAKENLEAILPLLPHACMQAAGADSRQLHSGGVQQLEAEAGVSSGASEKASSKDHSHTHHAGHSHSHGHTIPVPHTRPEDRPQQSNDPQLGPSRRYRESPYPLIKVEEAIRIIIDKVPKARRVTKPVSPDSCYHILAEDITAQEAVPAFRASIVDGYAINVSKHGTSKGVFQVAAVSHAAPGTIQALGEGQVARITTGAPLPPNATAVVMVEDTLLKSTTSDGSEEATIEILTDAIKPGENVREIGSDVAVGSVILRRGEMIQPTGGELGLLASAGVREIAVYDRPTIGIMSTGDEIVPADRAGPLQLGQVRDSNRMTLLAALRSWGQACIDLGIAPDNEDALEARLRAALGKCDVLLTSGGASMGERDLLKPILERRLGAMVHFGRVAMKPGKPTTFCTATVKDAVSGQPMPKAIFSLPGNPASAMVTAAVFALPGIMAMSGMTAVHDHTGKGPALLRVGLPRARVTLATGPVHCDKLREEYVRASVTVAPSGRLTALTTGAQRSSRAASLARANGLLVLPAGAGALQAGAQVDCLLIGQVGGL